jgi:lipopolysaccharide export system permease protein
LGLQIFIELTREFSSLGNGDYGIQQMLTYVTLMLPYSIYQFFPMVCLLGFIIAIDSLAANSELIIMRASGTSLFKLLRIISKPGILLIILMLLIGEVLSPMALTKAEKLKLEAIHGGNMLLTKQGRWLHSNQEIIHIKTIAGREITDITKYKIDGGFSKLQSISHTSTGHYDGKQWILDQSVRTKFGEQSTALIHSAQELSAIQFPPKLLSLDSLDSDQKNIVVLYSYAKQHILSGLDASKYMFAFWQRVLAPLAALIMILLAMPCVLGFQRQTTMGLRMLMGISLGFAFYIINQFVGPFSMVYSLPPYLAAALPLLVFAIFGLFLLAKTR